MRSWQHAQRSLRETLGDGTYETWIKPLRLSEMRDGHVCLDAPSKFFRDWVERRHLAALKEALRDEVHSSPEVVLQVKANVQGELFGPSEPVPPADKPATRESKPTVAARLAHLVPRYTFENFVVGPSNQLAHAAARAIANNPGAVYNPVFIYGTTGVGKTHLVNADVYKRQPLITSSKMSSAPAAFVMRRSSSRYPGAGGTTPMFAAIGSTITAATGGPASSAACIAGTSLYSTTLVSREISEGTPALSGTPNVAAPEPARTRS